MSVFSGLKKLASAAVDVVMLAPDVLADGVAQEWHEPGVESRTRKRLRRMMRRTIQGGVEVYQNKEDEEPLMEEERFRKFLE